MRSNIRSAFTLVELLVVIAIIGILISLLLPAVQACREAARRASCSNNMMQLAVAVQNYESAHEVLPPGVVNPTGPIRNEAKGYHYGWLVQLLPYVEQRNAYRAVDFSVGVYDAKNAPVRKLEIPIFLCPSESAYVRNASSYAGCQNDVEAPIAEDNHGVFFLNSHVRYRDIEDGSSQTIFIGEQRNDNRDNAEARNESENGLLSWASGTRATLRNTGSPLVSGFRGRMEGETIPADEKAAEKLLLRVGGFGSSHPGGAGFCFGDGSVHFLSENIDATLLQQLGNRADGKLLDMGGF
jgi:prepilin-type N-terminal cleavage/methylation domain-containing protein/prepilin-type processing-associated H-X9-DG protein